MKLKLSFISFFSISCILTSTCLAQLPSMEDQKWANYFLGVETRKIRFGITSDGSQTFFPLTKRGDIQSVWVPIKFKIEILEIAGEGKTTSKQVRKKSLKTEHPAVLNPQNPVTYRGEVTGDAAFEVTITPERDGFGVSGKILDQGSLKNPLKLVVTIGFDPYRKLSDPTKSELKKYDKRTRRDDLEVFVSFNEKKKFDFDQKVNLSQTFPSGAESLTYQSDGYDRIEFGLKAHGDSKLTFPDDEELMIGNGVNIQWTFTGETGSDKEKLVITAK